jgi:hypothetical protein
MSADFAYISPQTAAKTSPVFDARGCDGFHVSADNLAAAEVVNISVVAGSTNKVLTDAAGVAIKLTATVPSLYLQGGTFYVFDKTITAGLCGVYVNVKQR